MSSRRGAAKGLRGRSQECAALDALVTAAKVGDSRALVLRGEVGIGKTALLEWLAARSRGSRVLRAVGVESEVELPFASVHQLSQWLLDDLQRLRTPARGAGNGFRAQRRGPSRSRLRGLRPAEPASEHAEARPLLCLIDDAQWLDRSSSQVLSFVARRLHAESVVIVFAERDGSGPSEFEDLPELRPSGLSDEDSADLIASVTLGPLDETVLGRIITEAHGNPLALLEFSLVGDRRWRWRAATPVRAGCPSRAGYRHATGTRSGCSRRSLSICCWWRRPTPWATRACCPGCDRARDPCRGRGSRGGGGPDRDRRACALPPPAAALGDLPGGLTRAASQGAPGLGLGY
jgi:hypothetical protein